MNFYLDTSITQNFERAVQKEWLETNGLGGWASSTIISLNTRRYHGLLVAATNPPVGRMVLVSKIDESVVIDQQRFHLSSNRYPDAIHPHGYEYLQSFEREVFPVFTYKIGDFVLRKTIAAVYGENSTLIVYDVLQSPSSFILELQPFIAGRDIHNLIRSNDSIRYEGFFKNNIFRVQPYQGVPEIFISIPQGSFQANPAWYYNFEYNDERYRGLDYREDLFSYGLFSIKLSENDTFGIILSDYDPGRKDAFAMYDREKQRREKLSIDLTKKDDYLATLALAADQFIVRRGDDMRSIIAGYHWFADWGRDTMIALPGLTLATGRFEDAKKILRAFTQSIDQGMMPNRFPDSGEQPEYNTVDAALWFFVAVYKYLEYTDDETFVKDELMPGLREIISWYEKGTRYNIHKDDDDLLYAGEPGVQLTWMDAKVGDWVVTPRQGKAVEINALWYNALKIFSYLLHRYGENARCREFEEKAERTKRQFLETFWYDKGGYLYDYVDGEHRDAAIRPNQIFAVSLPYPLLTGAKANEVLQTVEEKLYTPFGLRSLSPDDPDYRPVYGGDPLSRDSAYHQGTVWSWLLGPYVDGIIKVEGIKGKERCRKLLESMRAHLQEAGIGTISEIFDADQPHTPRGAVAQAWSVGELLRVHYEYDL